ncbi:Histidine N-alpha-methyltransferase [Frankia sp. AiPs1]|uniref:L-histidine N(alpha)-methyltransferase n=1 Tax=Frankia sp. AiPa1 TaxID=573492 RepID=UPI00202ADBE4|nr:L-histidine N(alpha)-methyltransferase [Frankia sp. AiPa1]MCL9760677.1 L-histidine N(alpha)-methyltransferase [Frankia sp. AiPa1]
MTARTPTTSPTGTADPADSITVVPRESELISAPDGGPALTVQRHVREADRAVALARDVLTGLTAPPRSLPPKWFYDARGGILFEEITRLPEYYPTRRERTILELHAADIAAVHPVDTLIELGSGSSSKTRLLLDALRDTGCLRRFAPFDVDETSLIQSGQAILADYPGLAVHAVVGDFERHLSFLPTGGHRMIAFLGGTIGNMRPESRQKFLTTLRGQAGPGDTLLIGTDLLKDPDRLVAAYDDGAGVTAAFNRNILTVLNRELGANFDVRGFAHIAQWNAADSWIEMRLRAVRDQQVTIDALALSLDFVRGEDLLTEISAKFVPEGIDAELAQAGWACAARWTDPDGDFALTLAAPTTPPPPSDPASRAGERPDSRGPG